MKKQIIRKHRSEKQLYKYIYKYYKIDFSTSFLKLCSKASHNMNLLLQLLVILSILLLNFFTCRQLKKNFIIGTLNNKIYISISLIYFSK